MRDKELKINFTEYSSLDEMNTQDRELATNALEAMNNAYAPYSNFYVGAAVRMTNNIIIKGSNQENAAYPSGTCAERSAMFAAGANFPKENIQSIALAGGPKGELCEKPVMPCGACRQVMAEYQLKAKDKMSVIMIGKNKIWKFEKVNDILPFIFDSL